MLVGVATASRGGEDILTEDGVRKPTMHKISTNAEYRRCISGVGMTRSGGTTPLLSKQQQQQQSSVSSDEQRQHASTKQLKVHIHRQTTLGDCGGGEALNTHCVPTDCDHVTRV
jgi:hypothetical protein